MMPSPVNVLAYSVQLGVLAIAALLITRALRLRAPLPSLRFWQAILAVSLFLPLVQPRAHGGAAAMSSAALAPFAGAVRVDAITARSGDVAPWLLLVVLTGIAIRLLWLTVGALRLRTITRGASFDRSLDPLLRELSASLGTEATIAISEAVESPSTVGVRRPLILLPRRVLSMPPSVQRAVIAHELVHVRRRDWLHTIAEEMWCALLWFHPAARLIASRLSLARETLVDETTILLTRDRRAYAEALLAFASPQPHAGAPTTRTLRRGVDLPGVTPFIGTHLSQRISLIAEEEVMSRPRLLASLTMATLVCAAATVSAVSTVPMTAVAQSTQVYKPGKDVTLPTAVHEVKPSYTPEAMDRRIQGNVLMSVVVLETGDVGYVKITHSLDAEYGLDQAAVDAAKQWKFRPGTKDGQPVAVEIMIQITYALK
jgi:TonB family protein